MAPTAALPTLTAEPGFPHYLEEIRRFPMLERREGYMLAKRWREHGDRGAAQELLAGIMELCHRLTPVGLIPSLASLRTGAAPAVQPDLSRRSSPASVFR
jgi:hypothetical protein